MRSHELAEEGLESAARGVAELEISEAAAVAAKELAEESAVDAAVGASELEAAAALED